jgi:hypothetical protein
MRTTARFLFGILFFLVFFVFLNLKTPAFAQGIPAESESLHYKSQAVMIEVMSAMLCQLVGYDAVKAEQRCLGIDPETKELGYVENSSGLVGAMGTLIGYTFTPPASSTQYVAYLKNNFGIADKAYANTGFEQLNPIIEMWKVMRNFVYLIFVVIFVVIGLGVILRLHIDPRTVMTIQNQIPKIIAGILLVSFSFAIAGFMIDIMYVATYLGAALVTQATPNVDPGAVITSVDPFGAANSAFSDVGGITGMVQKATQSVTNLVNSVLVGPSGSNYFVDAFGNIDLIGGAIRSLVGIIVGLLGFLIIAIAVIYALFRLWIILLFSYVNILLDIIFAPFWFIIGLLPGSQTGVGGWFRDLVANLSVFPATIIMLLLARFFMVEIQTEPTSFIPPIIAKPTDVGAVSGLIGLGFIFMLPNVLTTMKAALKAPKTNLGPVFKPGMIGAGVVGNLPKRAIHTAERIKYAQEATPGKERFFALFGNPLYSKYRSGLTDKEREELHQFRAKAAAPGPGGTGHSD